MRKMMIVKLIYILRIRKYKLWMRMDRKRTWMQRQIGWTEKKQKLMQRLKIKKIVSMIKK